MGDHEAYSKQSFSALHLAVSACLDYLLKSQEKFKQLYSQNFLKLLACLSIEECHLSRLSSHGRVETYCSEPTVTCLRQYMDTGHILCFFDLQAQPGNNALAISMVMAQSTIHICGPELQHLVFGTSALPRILSPEKQVRGIVTPC